MDTIITVEYSCKDLSLVCNQRKCIARQSGVIFVVERDQYLVFASVKNQEVVLKIKY